jgi:hypothetical protein
MKMRIGKENSFVKMEQDSFKVVFKTMRRLNDDNYYHVMVYLLTTRYDE